MTEKNDGGPAFPVAIRTNGDRIESAWGMSLRDWFAGQALAGYLSNPNFALEHSALMSACYEQADAMLAEREKER